MGYMSAVWLSISLIAVMSLPGWGQAQLQDRFALTAGEVARALSESGMQTTEGQVSLLTRVVATESFPALDVLAVEPLVKQPVADHSRTRSRVRLACHQPGECLPFYAIASWSEPKARSAATPSSPSAVPGNMMFNPKSEITMRAGTHAMLIMDDHRSHIQVAVISLENGMAGHRIRVSSPDHRQVYFGEVVSANLLKGSF
jgi:hypothetical protein